MATSGTAIASSSSLPARVAITAATAISVVNVTRDHNLRLDLSADNRLITTSGGHSPGCFPLCGWTKLSLRSPACSVVTVNKPDVSAPSMEVVPTAHISDSSHSYAREKASPCASSQQVTSPTRRHHTLFDRIPVIRKPVVCEHCQAALGAESAARTASDLGPIKCSSSIHRSPSTPTNRCVICSKVSAFEARLTKAFFSPDLINGKSECYSGLTVECYRKWFKERPLTRETVYKTEPKRMAMLTKLQRQHKLHDHKLKDECTDMCAAFAVATCFISVADGDLELIVGNHGSMLHFSCVPREIGMCDFAMGAPEQHLLVRDVAADPVFRENPLLLATKALFYFAIPVLANGTAIGAVAVMDVSARSDSPAPAAVALMKKTAEAMGSRVSAHLAGKKSARRGLSSDLLRRQPRR